MANAQADTNLRWVQRLFPWFYHAAAVSMFQLIEEKGYIRGYPGNGGRGTAPDYVGKFYNGSFPDNFKWGVAMSTYQPESKSRRRTI